jgi:putative DNA primase/helicase
MSPKSPTNVVSLWDAGKQPWYERGSDDLLPKHVAYLTARGIKKSYFEIAGYRSEPDGLVIPYPDPAGGFLADFGRKRLLPARVVDGKEQKFSQPPGRPPRFYFAPHRSLAEWLRDPTEEVFVFEGETRGAALTQHGRFSISLGGVWNWLRRTDDGESVPIDDFDLVAWKGRPAVLVFDHDVAKKRDVQLALLRLANVIAARGGSVRIVLLPDLGDGKTGADDFIAARGVKAFLALPRRSLDEPEFEGWGMPADLNLTDAGNAERFAHLYADTARYVHEWSQWLVWDGARWKPDAIEQAVQLALKVARSIFREAAACPDADRRAELAVWALKSEAASKIEATLRIARTTPPLALTVSVLDAHPFLFGVRNGVVDLRTGELRPALPEWLMTKQAPIVFDPGAKCPAFERFLTEVMGGRADLVAYLRRCVGYFLTGDTREQCFFIWHGVGANGKSTLLQTLLALAGEYGGTSRMETWTAQQRNAGGPSEDVARLHGARLVSAVESEEIQRLAESLIKELTGSDKVAARRLYENSFEFVPQFKLILVCNHRPMVHGDDPAIWRRLRLVPFDRVFKPEEQDRTLTEKLRAELPGILNWAIAGCLEWQRRGLAEPDAVRRAVDAYRSDSDLLAQFIDEECAEDAKATMRTIQLYGTYQTWAETRGHRPMTMTSFSRKIQDRGYRKERDKKTRLAMIHGLRPSPSAIRAPPPPDEPPPKNPR